MKISQEGNKHRQQNDCGLRSYDNSKNWTVFFLNMRIFSSITKKSIKSGFKGFYQSRSEMVIGYFIRETWLHLTFTGDQEFAIESKNSITANFSQKAAKNGM